MLGTSIQALYGPKDAYPVTPLTETIAISTEKYIVIVVPTKYDCPFPFLLV
jgi:hypothetical protein